MKGKTTHTMRYSLLFLLTCLFFGTASANNVEITNIVIGDELTTANIGGYFIDINFDLRWENSWRLDVGPANFDGVYVFARYRTNGSGEWQHLGNTIGTNSTEFNRVGFAENGYIIYRQNAGSGDVSVSQYMRGAITDPSFDPNSEIEIRLFAVEMVWVPEGAFDLGDPNGVSNSFYRASSSGGNDYYTVRSENAITLANGNFSDLRVNRDSPRAGLTSGTIPARFPKGFDGFWTMKYEVSQQQYADFFNTLTDQQKVVLDPTGPDGKNTNNTVNRNACRVTNGEMSTSLPNVAMNYLNSTMMLAYLDWAGLRPMTEFEYEKACRGDRPGVNREFAWGTDEIAGFSYNSTNVGTASEGQTGLSTTAGNAIYSETADLDGPVRVGAIPANVATPTREQSGASLYGIMELSGNLTEWTISAGSTTSRLMPDVRGDYELGPQGQAVVVDPGNSTSRWPAPNDASYSLRGGSYASIDIRLRVADRFSGTVPHTSGSPRVGFRGAVSTGYNQVN